MFATKGPIAVQRSPRSPKGFVAYAKGILAAWTGNASLPNPTPTLAVFGADITALDQAATNALDRSPVAVAERNARALKVYQDLGHLLDYLQGLVQAQTSLVDAIALIKSAGFDVRQAAYRQKADLAAKATALPGTALLVARAVPGAGVYYWEVSPDGKTFTSLPDTRKASTTVPNLTVGQTYYFRMHALTRKGKTDYTPVVAFLVH
jgi:hypothetical protein